jgi:hypothetical protein
MRRVFLWVGLVALARAYEAPQIWTVDGASVAYTRADIEQKLGRPTWDRPLKASLDGETWEYTYGNGLKVDFRDRDPGRHALLLVGRHFSSRGLLMFSAGVGRERFIQGMGAPPLAQDDDQVVYYDEDRLVYLTAYFAKDRAREFVLSRFRIDK